MVAAFAIYKTVLWNRKKATIDKLEAYDYYASYSYLERTVEFHSGENPIDRAIIRKHIQEDPEILNHMFTVLQYHTSLVRGVENGTYSKRIVDANRSNGITRAYFMFSDFIDDRRDELNMPDYYEVIEEFALKDATKRKNVHKNMRDWAEDRITSKKSVAAARVKMEREWGRLRRWKNRLGWWISNQRD